MSEQLLWFIAGVISTAVVGFLINLLTTALFPWIHLKYRLWALRRKSKSKTPVIVSHSPTRLSVGGFSIDYIVLASGRYVPNRIQCFYNDRPMPLPNEFKRAKEVKERDVKKKIARGESGQPYNSPGYKLKAFDVGYREIIDGEEVPILRLTFCPTDYFTQLVTDLAVTDPVREKYAGLTDITVQPVPEFSSIMGICLNLITRDGYLIVTDRNPFMHSGAGKLHCSVAENLLRPVDAGPNGAPDLYRAALRAAQEELGLVLKPEDLELFAFGVDPIKCQYTLVGWCRIEETAKEVEELRAIALPKDKWENRNLIPVPCNPDAIAQFIISNKDKWESYGVSAVVLVLFQMGYSKKDIDQAFLRAQSKTV